MVQYKWKNTNGVLLPVTEVMKDKEKLRFHLQTLLWDCWFFFFFFNEGLQRSGAAEVAVWLGQTDVKRSDGWLVFAPLDPFLSAYTWDDKEVKSQMGLSLFQRGEPLDYSKECKLTHTRSLTLRTQPHRLSPPGGHTQHSPIHPFYIPRCPFKQRHTQ